MKSYVFAVLTLLAHGAVAPSSLAEPPERSAAEMMDAVMWNREPIGGPFALVDHHGAPRTQADFEGKLLLVYFGFTYCPRLPLTCRRSVWRWTGLGKSGEAVQPLFITLDAERDTPEHLAGYVSLFHPRLIGLSGDETAVRHAARAYKVFYAKVPRSSNSDYTLDHSAFIYLMDRSGRYLGFFPPGTPPDRIADVIRPLLVR